MKIDVGCGNKCKDGFIGLDRKRCKGVKIICDIEEGLPFENNSVEEIFSSNCLEHLKEPMVTIEEFYRVLKPNAKCVIIVPYAFHPRASVPTHKTFWGMESKRMLNEYHENKVKWSKVKMCWIWGERKAIKHAMTNVMDWLIKKNCIFYEYYFGRVFPPMELKFEMVK